MFLVFQSRPTKSPSLNSSQNPTDICLPTHNPFNQIKSIQFTKPTSTTTSSLLPPPLPLALALPLPFPYHPSCIKIKVNQVSQTPTTSLTLTPNRRAIRTNTQDPTHPPPRPRKPKRFASASIASHDLTQGGAIMSSDARGFPLTLAGAVARSQSRMKACARHLVAARCRERWMLDGRTDGLCGTDAALGVQLF